MHSEKQDREWVECIEGVEEWVGKWVVVVKDPLGFAHSGIDCDNNAEVGIDVSLLVIEKSVVSVKREKERKKIN